MANMVKNPFDGQLNSNEIFSAIYNMIISQDVKYPSLAHNYALVNDYRVDGTLYGDTKLFYASDVLNSRAWANDSEAGNLLAINRPDAPKCQAVTLDTFRQIDITVDQYLSKRAWSTEGAFSQFTSVILAMLNETKNIHDVTLFNAYVGNTVSSATKATVQIDLSGITQTGEEKNRLEAETIAQGIADLVVDMKDYSRDYNDYKFLRAYNEGDIKIIWNSKFINKIKKVDLPTIFHKDGLIDKFEEKILPERYFGTVITATNVGSYSAATPTTGKPLVTTTGVYTPGTKNANGCVRSLVEKDVTVSGTAYHVFAGDEIPAGATVLASSGNFAYGEVYINDATIICKVVTPRTFVYMSAFEVATEFFNPRSLTSNHYLTWGYSAPDYLRDEPLITVKAKLS